MINTLADNHIAEVHLALCMLVTMFITIRHVSIGTFLWFWWCSQLFYKPHVFKKTCDILWFLQKTFLAKGYAATDVAFHGMCKKDYTKAFQAAQSCCHSCWNTCMYIQRTCCIQATRFVRPFSVSSAAYDCNILQPCARCEDQNKTFRECPHMTFRMLCSHLLVRYIIMNHVSSVRFGQAPHFLAPAHAFTFCAFG